MIKIVLILIWPAAIAAIGCAAALLTGRPPVAGGLTAVERASAGRAVARGRPGMTASGAIVRLAAIVTIGALLVYGLMALLGLLVVHNGPTIDRPIYNWMIAHRVDLWTAPMKRLTKIGDPWTTWGAAVAAAVCLAATGRRDRWLAPVVLGSLIVVDHFVTLAVRHTISRLGPPDSPLGTYPSGGCDRVIVFYGVIAYLLWREHTGQRRTAIWAAAAVAALAFNEGYSRAYLSLHWFTDILSGLLYGALLLAVFIIAVRFVAGPTIPRKSPAGSWERGVLPSPLPTERARSISA
jgi:membrane-associated phospholipid phosphatase